MSIPSPYEADELLVGWEEIEGVMRLKSKALRKLSREAGLPIYLGGGRPMTTRGILLDWVKHQALRSATCPHRPNHDCSGGGAA